jgi:large subunit ribosomal protein L32
MHLFLKNPGLVLCKKCAKKILPHMACPYCGMYQGRQVVDVLSQLAKKEKKAKNKQNR